MEDLHLLELVGLRVSHVHVHERHVHGDWNQDQLAVTNGLVDAF